MPGSSQDQQNSTIPTPNLQNPISKSPIPPSKSNSSVKFDVFNQVFMPTLKQFCIEFELSVPIAEKLSKDLFDKFAQKPENSRARGRFFATTSDPRHVEMAKAAMPEWFKRSGSLIKESILKIMKQEEEQEKAIERQNNCVGNKDMDAIIEKYNLQSSSQMFQVKASKKERNTILVTSSNPQPKLPRSWNHQWTLLGMYKTLRMKLLKNGFFL